MVRRCCISLVSKRWRHALFSAPSLWRSFELDGNRASKLSQQDMTCWLSAKHGLLQRVAPSVRELTVKEWRTFEHAYAHACAGSPGVGSWPLASVLGAVEQQLTSLDLHWCFQLPRGVISMLPRMPRLLSLACTTDSLPAAAFGIVAQLTQLTCLKLEFRLEFMAMPSSTLALTALQQLRQLQIWLPWMPAAPAGSRPAVPAPSATSFPSLRHLSYYS
jgi:hypothetical protein